VAAVCAALVLSVLIALLALALWGAMTPTDKNTALEAVTASLRDVTSIRDFTAAVEVGAKVAHGMLDDVEAKLLDIMRTVNEDQ
jgi:parvulin-like peptidyl-prolyl isomerase